MAAAVAEAAVTTAATVMVAAATITANAFVNMLFGLLVFIGNLYHIMRV